MARKSNKDDVSVTFAVAGTDDDDVLNGRNDAPTAESALR